MLTTAPARIRFKSCGSELELITEAPEVTPGPSRGKKPAAAKVKTEDGHKYRYTKSLFHLHNTVTYTLLYLTRLHDCGYIIIL